MVVNFLSYLFHTTLWRRGYIKIDTIPIAIGTMCDLLCKTEYLSVANDSYGDFFGDT